MYAAVISDPFEVVYYSFFFFQAEDGIRDIGVTGVQTCALPILAAEIVDLARLLWCHHGARALLLAGAAQLGELLLGLLDLVLELLLLGAELALDRKSVV